MTADDERWHTFESAVRLHHADLHAFAYRVLGGKEQAEDALQSAYVKAFRAVRAGPLGSPVNRPWLFRIVYHCCIDELRRSARTTHDTLDELALVAEAGDEELGLARALSRALLELPPSTRAAVLLVDVQGLSYDEAATALGVPRGTIASRLNHGRDALREALPEYAPNWRRA